MTLPAAAAERRLHAYAANQLHAAAAVDQRDRQSDGRTTDGSKGLDPHNVWIASIDLILIFNTD